MPTDRSLAEMQALAERHTYYEFSHEIDKLMATVHSEPGWHYEPIGCSITSVEGVSQMYQRMFPIIGAMGAPDVVNSWFADDGFIGEVRIVKPLPDGGERASSQFSWCEFTGDLVSGECNYVDAEDAPFLVAVLGEDFFGLPGVEIDATVAPGPDPM